MDVEHLAREAIDCGYQIHNGLGPGLLESVYETVLAASLQKRGFQVQRQKSVSFTFQGMTFDEGLRVDLLVEGMLLLELKSAENNAPVHAKQLLTYLRLMNMPLGILMNFGMATFKEGVHRIANKHIDPPYFKGRVGGQRPRLDRT